MELPQHVRSQMEFGNEGRCHGGGHSALFMRRTSLDPSGGSVAMRIAYRELVGFENGGELLQEGV